MSSFHYEVPTFLNLLMYLCLLLRTIGITIGTTILQNSLKSKLPPSFTSRFPSGVDISYSIIPIIKHLPEPLRTQVKHAFGSSIANIWRTNIGLGGLGLLTSLLIRNIPLRITTDKNWDLTAAERQKQEAKGNESGDVEKAGVIDSKRTSSSMMTAVASPPLATTT